MYSDLQRFRIVRRDLLMAVGRARSLDDLLSMIRRKYMELKGTATSTVAQTQNMINFSNTPPPPPPPPPDNMDFNNPSAPVSQKSIKCAYCGEKLDSDREIVFCPNCGSPLE